VSGQYILQGAQAMAQGIQQMTETLSKAHKERKNYLGIADALKDSGQLTDLQREALNHQSTDKLIGQVKGILMADELRRAKQAGELTAEQLNAVKYNLQEKKRQDAAQSKFNMMMAGRTAPMPPLPGATAPAPRQPITPEEIYGMAGSAGVDTASMIPEMAKAAKRYNAPGTVVDLPGVNTHKFVFETENSGVPVQVKTTGNKPTVEQSGIPDIFIGTDEAGKVHFINRSGDLGYGPLGKSELDMARIESAELDRQIMQTQAAMTEKGAAGLVPKLNDKGQRIPTGVFGWGAGEQWTLQEQFNDLLRKKGEAATRLRSLQQRAQGTPTSPATNAAPAAAAAATAPGGTNTVGYSDFEEWQKRQKK